jgi:hypothetical protein
LFLKVRADQPLDILGKADVQLRCSFCGSAGHVWRKRNAPCLVVSCFVNSWSHLSLALLQQLQPLQQKSEQIQKLTRIEFGYKASTKPWLAT